MNYFEEERNIKNLQIQSDFFKKLEEANYIFAGILKPYIKTDLILEIVNDQDYSVGKYLKPKKLYIKGTEREFTYENHYVREEEKLSGHLLCNGSFEEIHEFLPRVLDKGSFTIGVCEEKSISYRKKKRLYKRVFDTLLQMGYPVVQEEQRVKKYGIYLLRSKK